MSSLTLAIAVASLATARGLTCGGVTCKSDVTYCVATLAFTGPGARVQGQLCDNFNPELQNSICGTLVQRQSLAMDKCVLLDGGNQFVMCKRSDFGQVTDSTWASCGTTITTTTIPTTTTQCISTGTADCPAAGAKPPDQYDNCLCPQWYACDGCGCNRAKTTAKDQFTWFPKTCTTCKCTQAGPPAGLASGAFDQRGKILAGLVGAVTMMCGLAVHG